MVVENGQLQVGSSAGGIRQTTHGEVSDATAGTSGCVEQPWVVEGRKGRVPLNVERQSHVWMVREQVHLLLEPVLIRQRAALHDRSRCRHWAAREGSGTCLNAPSLCADMSESYLFTRRTEWRIL